MQRLSIVSKTCNLIANYLFDSCSSHEFLTKTMTNSFSPLGNVINNEHASFQYHDWLLWVKDIHIAPSPDKSSNTKPRANIALLLFVRDYLFYRIFCVNGLMVEGGTILLETFMPQRALLKERRNSFTFEFLEQTLLLLQWRMFRWNNSQ